MLEKMFEGIFTDSSNLLVSVIITMAVSLVCGAVIAVAHRIKTENCSKNFLITLVLLPIITQAVVLMVNRYGSIGTGLAIAGAFALVRFRSVGGSVKDITCILFASAVGIATGVGQIYFAMIITAVVSCVYIGLKFIPLDKANRFKRKFRVTVPEDLDFQTEFAPIFQNYTKAARLIKIKTSKMGSVYVLTYDISLKDIKTEKKLIDEIRVKNSNLPISCNTIIETEEFD